MRLLTVVVFVLTLNIKLTYSSWAESFPQDSLFNVKFSWIDDQGKAFQLAKDSGRNTVLTMAYSHCKSACPLTVERLRRIDTELKKLGKQADFVVVSLDPANDTPEALAEFKKAHKIDLDNWHLLHGSDEDVRKLSIMIGYSYKRDFETTEIMHSNKILLLGADGRINLTLEGLDSDIQPLVVAAK